MDNRIIKYYAGEFSKEERRTLLQEAFSNQELKKEMMYCQQLQSLMKLHPQEKQEIIGEESLRHFLQVRQAEKGRRVLLSFLRYAAIVVLCISVTWWWTTFSPGKADAPHPLTQKLSVPAGQRAHITLPDGSKVWVNANSVLTYPSAFSEERRVKLTGEAFFEVAKSPTPFIVSTGKVDIKALGTQFNVFNYPEEDLTVSLLEGSVRVYLPHKEQCGMVLQPKQKLTETQGHFSVKPITQNPVLWKEGLYTFEKQKLKDIVKKLELYYDIKITIKDTSIQEYEYTGKFRQRDGVMEVLQIIRKIHPFKIKKNESTNEIILYR